MVGYSTFLLVDATLGFGVVVLTNSNGDNLHAQMLARATHADVLGRMSTAGDVVLPDPDPRLRMSTSEHDEERPSLSGLFLKPGRPADSEALSIHVAEEAVSVDYAGETGTVYRTLTGRYVTNHKKLRDFHLDFADDEGVKRWTHGPTTWLLAVSETSGEGQAPQLEPDRMSAALVGQYRTYSPWFPMFRIVWREGELFLSAPGGVEAPSEEELLVEIEPEVFRVGSDPWLPERLTVGPIIGGHAISVALDGCVYSRTGL
jgi:hypothetical protein